MIRIVYVCGPHYFLLIQILKKYSGIWIILAEMPVWTRWHLAAVIYPTVAAGGWLRRIALLVRMS